MGGIRVSGLPLEHICLVICPAFAGSRNENGTYAITDSDIYMFESSQSGGNQWNHCFGIRYNKLRRFRRRRMENSLPQKNKGQGQRHQFYSSVHIVFPDKLIFVFKDGTEISVEEQAVKE